MKASCPGQERKAGEIFGYCLQVASTPADSSAGSVPSGTNPAKARRYSCIAAHPSLPAGELPAQQLRRSLNRCLVCIRYVLHFGAWKKRRQRVCPGTMSGSASDLYAAEAWEEKYDPSRYQGRKTPVSRSGGRQQAFGGCLRKESELHKVSYLPKWWRDMQQAIFRRQLLTECGPEEPVQC